MLCVIDCGTSWLGEIKNNLDNLGHESRVVKLDEIKNTDLNNFCGIIISGAPTLLTKVNLEEYLHRFGFLRSTKLPVLGICLGHQVMGLIYGAKINAKKMIDKMEKIQILEQDYLFEGIKTLSEFREEHSEFITLPKGFIKLAKSDSCENESMKHKDKNLFGVQFHPEVSGENGKKIFANFLKLC